MELTSPSHDALVRPPPHHPPPRPPHPYPHPHGPPPALDASPSEFPKRELERDSSELSEEEEGDERRSEDGADREETEIVNQAGEKEDKWGLEEGGEVRGVEGEGWGEEGVPAAGLGGGERSDASKLCGDRYEREMDPELVDADGAERKEKVDQWVCGKGKRRRGTDPPHLELFQGRSKISVIVERSQPKSATEKAALACQMISMKR